MDNQHRKIAGYRELNQVEIDMMNRGKCLAAAVGAWVEELQATPEMDQRNVALAKTNLQQGFMWGIRAIAKPTTFG